MPPPPKLYRVTVGFSLYVLASDRDDAQGVAVRNAAEEIRNLAPRECLGAVAEVEDSRSIDADWRGSRPYATPGTQHERLNCAEALAAIQAERRRADLPGQQKLFGEAH